ncbi:DUF423 domain-containing protein [Lyngbya sp. PCC 8106]|uniref:DUF423 domain-containing protein n=1 Tax=Lyngbya sp. (strain PCC 8106) TaxID=313612 RepID=UPI0000EA899C|nr:DUF423 domain-containing protein [Lyngbya sp. PCC 8106]EAW37285.1 hypothetical protein L8106_11432 [Lyngbya sp. PCC 8106]
MERIFLPIAAILGGLSVMAGAFGAHALSGKISERAIEIFETGARYQMYHALALFLIAVLLRTSQSSQALMNIAGTAFIIGVAIFSGSLYALSLTGIKWLGAITPLGGVALIAGWGCLAIAAFKL